MKRWMKKGFAFIRREDANTAEDNTNRGMWWIAGIVVFAVVGGVLWYVIGHTVSQTQGGASSLTTSLSSQGGLDTLAQNAEAGTSSVSNSSISASGFKAP